MSTLTEPKPRTDAKKGAEIHCTNCSNLVSKKAVACIGCGANPKAHKKFCADCGTPLNEEQVICIKCGVSVVPLADGKKSKTTAALLAILLGGLGVHHFYLGSWGWGLLEFLLCWTYIPALVGLIMGICWLCSSTKSFDDKYNRQPPNPWKF